MANCKFCNANIPDDSTFCPFCGKQMPLAPVQSAPVNQSPAAEEKPQPKKKKKKGGIIAAIIALLLVAGIGVTGFIFIDEIKELLGIETNIDEEEEEESTAEDEDNDDDFKGEEGVSTSVGVDEETEVATTAPYKELGNDVTSGNIEIDGVVYDYETPVSYFISNGWTIDYEDSFMPGNSGDYVMLNKGTSSIEVYISNESADDAPLENCLVFFISVCSDSCFVPVSLPSDVVLGEVNNQLESLFGPSSYGERHYVYVGEDYSVCVRVDDYGYVYLIEIEDYRA